VEGELLGRIFLQMGKVAAIFSNVKTSVAGWQNSNKKPGTARAVTF
jgi:hypothetical protein